MKIYLLQFGVLVIFVPFVSATHGDIMRCNTTPVISALCSVRLMTVASPYIINHTRHPSTYLVANQWPS